MKFFQQRFLSQPTREYIFISLLMAAFAIAFFFQSQMILLGVAALTVIPTFFHAIEGVRAFRINIDTFNLFAVFVSFMIGDAYSAGFIALMLTFARLLDWHTERRTHHAVEELMRLKPLTAFVERSEALEKISADLVQFGDVVVIKSGAHIPVDGIIVYGSAYINEAAVTGESQPLKKIAGDPVMSSTFVETGAIKIRATQVGRDSTIERMASLMREASLRKSHSEKLADRFAGLFMPFVALVGILVYVFTHNILMTAAFFLVACADDMAVAIPLAMTASLGQAAKRGVIVKGGQSLDVLARMRILVLDKTGTLTFGNLNVRAVRVAKGIEENHFWRTLAIAEKYSEHPAGRAAYHEAVHRVGDVPDPDVFDVVKGKGVRAKVGQEEIMVGTERFFEELGIARPLMKDEITGSIFLVAIDGKYIGFVEVADTPRPEAAESLRQLRELGVERIIMFTGDHERVAADIARTLDIKEYEAGMTPEEKLRALEALLPEGPVGMIGDGINDSLALARADVSIAMGTGGAAVSIEAADIVLMTDKIARIPEMIELGRRTFSVVRGDTMIWGCTNVVGFILVFTGVAGPAFAAFYNFVMDFLPLLNSSRLFRTKRENHV
ncbi:MAG: Copper-translocating P-type ATPase [Candidatus Uhrbacteria bacterium GW2011_GWF2_41_16]|uniref:Copper-translocating P-type ATPase n=2 Tax=Candidatus Uhriibacteriota TaxID=1752732 RepID=A0A0G0XMV7_9BACT|nr:MAG: Copper-translocating P-type ATPase [Candidatus Uhrbacteria bacterium GW2011_GWA2_41_10]KKR86727.1 MAG: Copper-translocating P-type ATPase [Candidatus Uhrbacteria bacterium GW2011_GWC2_41_11]KKR98105.1 MAG: Copper-translocating P-type ATPase [Candidatus Uhrbacteria bacterium GW2011_GWF2_41_16]HBP00331.1 cadmium-translocating P-type ATPase [Candidatus Uhrbacteria bacterium]